MIKKENNNYKRFSSLVLLILLVTGIWAPFVVSEDVNTEIIDTSVVSEDADTKVVDMFKEPIEQVFKNPTNSWQASEPSLDTEFNGSIEDFKENGKCGSTTEDFKIMVTKCSPQVVRSDLLAEQSVPVYCQLEAVKLNPFIKGSVINSISFKGEYPEGVQSISYHPAKAGVQSYKSIVGDDLLENIGYVVIVLNQQPNETDVNEYITGILTASIKYSSAIEYDMTEGDYYLKLEGQDENDFFGGQGSLSVTNYGDGALGLKVGFLLGEEMSLTLSPGSLSDTIYLPGYYCEAGFKVSFESYVEGRNKVSLIVDGNRYWLREDDTFLNGKCRVSKIVKDSGFYSYGTVGISCYGNGNSFNLGLKELENSIRDSETDNSDFETDFKDSVKDVKKLVNNYPNEASDNGKYAEKALFDQIVLARNVGKTKTQKELIDLLIETYPASRYINEVKEMFEQITNMDVSEASKNIELTGNGENHFIVLDDFDFMSSKSSVDLSIDDVDYPVYEGKRVGNYDILVDDVSIDKVSLKINGTLEVLEEGESITFQYNGEYYNLRVVNINTFDVAHIKVIPDIKEDYASANFSFGITVNKRDSLVQLTPEKAQERADDLNKTIESFEDVLGVIKTGVQVFKGACVAIKISMAIKVYFESISPTGVARKSVMGTMNEEYNSAVDKGDYSGTKEDFFLSKNADIEKAVLDYSQSIKSVKKDFSKIQKDLKTTDGDYNEQFLTSLKKEASSSRDFVEVGDEIVKIDSLKTTQQLESVMLLNELNGRKHDKCESFACKAAYGKVETQLKDIVSKQQQESQDLQQSLKYDGSGIVTGLAVGKDTDPSDKQTSCENNPMSEGVTVRYYDNGADERLAAIVPFDEKNGWYAYISSSTGATFDEQVQGYNENGLPKFFSICNVGDNGMIDYNVGEDICQSFSINQNSYDTFLPCPELSGNEVKKLFDKAYNAIEIANNNQGESTVNVLGQIFTVGQTMTSRLDYQCTDFLSPADCKMMMGVCDPVECPPSRCNLGGSLQVDDVAKTGVIGSIVLCSGNGFVCLPGIYSGLDFLLSTFKEQQKCLNTRATSGQYVGSCDKMASVYRCETLVKQGLIIVEGIMGNIFSPRVGGGLSGGGEYIAFENDVKDVQDSMGAFTSQYGADLFSSSVLDGVNLEKMSGDICGSYFSTIAPEVGLGDGFSLDGTLDILDKMTDFDTPSQIFASYSEALFNDVTVPSTSQYNVYYHIYAGSLPASYSIYLKNPPVTAEYSSHQTYNVASGNIPGDDSKSESRDFTAPSGYKELCVVVNGEESCGFTTVSDNYVVDLATDEYVKAQTDKAITTETQCYSTSTIGFEQKDVASLGLTRMCATAAPNTGSGQYIACSNEDKKDCSYGADCESNVCVKNGVKELKNARWVDVGYCGDKKNVCWLDTDSLRNSLEILDADSNSLIENLQYGEQLGDINKMYKDVDKMIKIQRKAIEGLSLKELKENDNTNIITALNQIVGVDGEHSGQGTNVQKAEALSLQVVLLQKRVEARFILDRIKINIEDVETEGGSEEDVEVVESVVEFDFNKLDIEEVNNGEWIILYDGEILPYYLKSKKDFSKYIIKRETDTGIWSSGSIDNKGKIDVNAYSTKKEFLGGYLEVLDGVVVSNEVIRSLFDADVDEFDFDRLSIKKIGETKDWSVFYGAESTGYLLKSDEKNDKYWIKRDVNSIKTFGTVSRDGKIKITKKDETFVDWKLDILEETLDIEEQLFQNW